MELEDLKSAWQSVKPKIDSSISEKKTHEVITRQCDVKSRFLRKCRIDGAITLVCLVLMGTSRIWAPMKLPYWWLSVFCAMLSVCLFSGIRIYRTIGRINLWEDTNQMIISTVVSVKKLYRNIELAATAVIMTLMVWISFTPPFINSWRMAFVCGQVLLAFGLEYLWYRSNIRQLNSIMN